MPTLTQTATNPTTGPLGFIAGQHTNNTLQSTSMTLNFISFIGQKATKPNGVMKYLFEIEIFTIYKNIDE
jgi:hypothetical protein